MFKALVNLFITLLLSGLLISSNALAFHKNNKESQKIYEDAKLTTKEQISAKRCAFKTKKWKEEQKQLEKDDGQLGWIITGYHDLKKNEAPPKWDFKIPLKNNIIKLHKKKLVYLESSIFIPEDVNTATSTDGKGITLEEFLKIICLQYDEKERPSKLDKKSSMYELFNKIAKKNGFIKNDKPNIKAKLTTKIYDEGLIIKEPNVVYYIPDYLITENIEIEQAKIDHNQVTKDTNDALDFIAKIKPPLVENITNKKGEFDNEIKDINNKYTKLKIKYENFVKYFKEKTIEIEDSLDYIDVSQKQIKDKAIELRKAKREFLNPIILDDFKDKYKKLKSIKSKNFKNYTKLENLLHHIEKKSNKKKCFEAGKKALGCKPSFPDQWDRIKSDELGAKPHEVNLDSLSSDIDRAKKDIVNNIDSLNQDIENLEKNLDNQIPWKLIVISVLVFLAVLGIAFYIYFNKKNMKDLKEESDKKVGSLKSEFENKLKNTSEQIRSARSQQSGIASEAKHVPEKPKTPEEIIAAKYDELVSDYKEALEDFSKVAGFKQKWNGLALSRKDRQDGTKTILINSTRVFEKAEIWCVTFSEKYFAFPGSTVKSNMAAWMNLDFEKASRDFKGVFAVSAGSSYSTEPSVLRRGGAGFAVERVGKIVFPN